LSVAHTFDPPEVWEGVPVVSDPERAALAASAGDRRLWRQIQRGDRVFFGAVEVEALNPAIPEWERQRVRNDDSIVLRVRYRDVEFLLTGDVGEEVEQRLAIDDRSPIRVLKAAHHGSRSSSSVEFLRRYAPHLALVSAGRGNPFGHPSGEVIDRLMAAGARVFRTDLDGAVTVETDGREVRVRSMTGRAWTMRVSHQPA
jgi:competence protein ComEC